MLYSVGWLVNLTSISHELSLVFNIEWYCDCCGAGIVYVYMWVVLMCTCVGRVAEETRRALAERRLWRGQMPYLSSLLTDRHNKQTNATENVIALVEVIKPLGKWHSNGKSDISDRPR